MLRQLLKDPKIGKLIVPIIPDEGAHVRHGVDHPPGRHLRQPGPALQAARSGHAAVLPRGEGRPDSGRRHHRGRLDGVVHRGGHGVRQLRRADDSVLHLLLDVRLPARRRHDLGLRRRARQGLPDGRHRRPHHAGRRRLAAPGRPQHRARQHRSHLPRLRSGLRLRDRRHRAGRHPPHVSGRAKTASTTSRCTTKTTRCRRCRKGCEEGILRGIYQFKAAGQGQGRRCSCSAAARF